MAKPKARAAEDEDEALEDEALEGEVVDDRAAEDDDGEERPPRVRTRVAVPAEDGEAKDDDEAERDEAEREETDEAFEPDAVLDSAALDEAEAEADIDVSRLPLPARKSSGGASEPALSLRDPLQAYMRDVQRYSLLKPEETHELAVKYVTTGDLDAARKLVTSNLRLVVKIAFDYRRAHRNILDLIQEGNIGLMQAVKKYDPYRGVKLSSYAAWWIRAYILRFILNNWRLVKLGTTQAQRKLFFNLKKEKARLSAMGIDPTPELIADRLHVTADEVIHMDRRLSSGEASLDAPVGGAGGEGRQSSRIELMADESHQAADEQLAEGELHDLLTEKIHEFGKTLTGKEAIIFEERLVADEPKTLQELGDRFGVSRERVRQLEKRLQGKIKTYLEANVEGSALP
jgi:RNA polymerase sigma-32 factor